MRTGTGISRRAFGAAAVVGLSGAAAASDRKNEPITAASVPDDPDAPKVQEGTEPEVAPFAETPVFRVNELPLKAKPFSLSHVRLLPSDLKIAQEANRMYLHELPVDRLLYNFRVNAGLPSQAKPLGGWEKPDCELRGHFVGHYLSACALTFSSTGDQEVKAKGEELVAELATCQDHLAGGYLSAFPVSLFDRLKNRTPVWAPFYTVHKIMAGLFDMHQQTGNKQALSVLSRMAEWTDQWTGAMPEAHMQMVLDTEYGGMNEVLYNLAAVSGNGKYAEVGDRFTKKRFFNPLALRQDQLRGLHANTHIPQVIGAARRYEISSDGRFGGVASYFWTEIADARTYASGGTSNNEGWLVPPYRLAAELSRGVDTNECCCVYNMLKLTRHLYTWSADPRYFDLYERILYNHRLGTIEPETGLTQYYLGMVPGSWRTFGTKFDTFWCCNGTGVEEFSKLNDSIYFHDEGGVYVNLFIPSELDWTEKNVRIRQQSKFPEEDAVHFTVQVDAPTRFALRIRVPGWVAAEPVVKLNGKDAGVSAAAGSYLVLARTWSNHDSIEIKLPMQLRYQPMPDDPGLRAVLYGPILLAGEVQREAMPEALVAGHMGPDLKKHPAGPIPSFEGGAKGPDSWIRATGNPLKFATSGQAENITLRPFYRVNDQRYSVYWRMA